jgi:hypothetical protein
MPGIRCQFCGIPLDNEKQFIGHYTIGHELTLESARSIWNSESRLIVMNEKEWV